MVHTGFWRSAARSISSLLVQSFRPSSGTDRGRWANFETPLPGSYRMVLARDYWTGHSTYRRWTRDDGTVRDRGGGRPPRATHDWRGGEVLPSAQWSPFVCVSFMVRNGLLK
jgi:hypothetical protein